jgi:hypothetical protein
MKNKISKGIENSIIDQMAKPGFSTNNNNNFNISSKNLKIEEMNNLNYQAHIPINIEEFNPLIDPNSINPGMLGNKFVSY